MNSLNRRAFIKTAVAAAAVVTAPGSWAQATPKPSPFVGIQIAAHSFFDEGIEHCLDLLRNSAGVNALFINSHSYYGAMGQPLQVMADHGVPLRDNSKRRLRRVWVNHHERYYQDTSLRHYETRKDEDYAGRDLFAELAQPARERGMKLFVRWYQASKRATPWIRNWNSVLELDVRGERGDRPCWNHPEYRAWLVATFRDLFENNPLDGLQYGAERQDPLSECIFRGAPPVCFCEHCRRRAQERGIDIEKARLGFAAVHDYCEALRKQTARPTDGPFAGLTRLLLTNPEMLAWNLEWFRAGEEVHRLIYGTVRKVRSGMHVGRHVDHQQSSWSLIYRACLSYAEMAQDADFIKLILYTDILGPRLKEQYLDRLHQTVFSDLTLEHSLAVFYSIFGHDAAKFPSLAQLEKEGFGAEYVFRETKRCVDGVQGRAATYAGIGLDIPFGKGWGDQKWISDPAEVEASVTAAFRAGAQGIVASREYEEISIPSLRVVGQAIRAAGKS
jgi:hypothetical protein